MTATPFQLLSRCFLAIGFAVLAPLSALATDLQSTHGVFAQADGAPPNIADPMERAAHDADQLASVGKLDQARDAYLSILATLVAKTNSAPSDRTAHAQLATVAAKLDGLYGATLEAAHLDEFRAIVDGERKLLADHPHNVQLALALSSTLARYGVVAAEAQGAAALAALKESFDLRSKISETDPEVAPNLKTFVLMTASILDEIGKLQLKAGDSAGLTSLRAGADRHKALALKFPDDVGLRGSAWARLFSYASAATNAGDGPAALAALNEAVELVEVGYGTPSPSVEVMRLQLMAYNALGAKEMQTGDRIGAKTILKKADALARTAGQAFPDDKQLQENSFYVMSQLIDVDMALNDFRSALSDAQEMAAAQETILKRHASSEAHQRHILALDRSGVSQFSLGHNTEAVQLLRSCAAEARATRIEDAAAGRYEALTQLTLVECLALIALVDSDFNAAVEAAPLLQMLQSRQQFPEKTDALRRILSVVVSKHIGAASTGVTYGGGDGSTVEKAIKINGARTDEAGTMSIISYINTKFSGCSINAQRLIGRGDSKFDYVACRYQNGMMKEFYFDITDSFAKR